MDNKEINLVEIFADLKRKRLFILRATVVGMCLGIVGALFVTKQYEAKCVIVPQSAGTLKIGGNLGGLAALAGIDISGGNNSSSLPINLYQNVFNNIHFRQELLGTPITLSKFDHNVTIREYIRSPKYKHFVWWQRFKAKTINYYSVKQRQKRIKQMNEMMERSGAASCDSTMQSSVAATPDFVALDAVEKGATVALDEIVDISIDQKNNFVVIQCSMPEPIAAAQVTSAVEQLLQKYIVGFKTQKAKDFLEFIQGRYDEAYDDYQEKRDKLARFQDSNTTIRSAVAQARMTRLEEESLAAFDVYASMTQQLEQAKVSVKEETPAFMVIEPVVNPVEPIGLSRAMIVFLFLFLGCVFAIFIIAFKQPILDIIPSDKLSNWFEKEDTSLWAKIKRGKKS